MLGVSGLEENLAKNAPTSRNELFKVIFRKIKQFNDF
jgi:hypothetical protein